METVITPLFTKKKNWDYAMIYCPGRAPIAIEPTTKFYLTEDESVLIIEDKEANNPLYRGQPDEPKQVHLVGRISVDMITSIDLLTFNKITPVKSIIA